MAVIEKFQDPRLISQWRLFSDHWIRPFAVCWSCCRIWSSVQGTFRNLGQGWLYHASCSFGASDWKYDRLSTLNIFLINNVNFTFCRLNQRHYAEKMQEKRENNQRCQGRHHQRKGVAGRTQGWPRWRSCTRRFRKRTSVRPWRWHHQGTNRSP